LGVVRFHRFGVTAECLDDATAGRELVVVDAEEKEDFD
jgi:hypothetical protein